MSTMITTDVQVQIQRDEDQQTLDSAAERQEHRLTDEQIASALLQYFLSGGYNA